MFNFKKALNRKDELLRQSVKQTQEAIDLAKFYKKEYEKLVKINQMLEKENAAMIIAVAEKGA